MELSEMMNQILSDACPSDVIEEFEDGRTKKAVFIVEVHCVAFEITAELNRDTNQFVILDYTTKDN